MLQIEHCRRRQERLIQFMQEEDLRAVVVGQPSHIYYFTGYRSFWLHEGAFVLQDDGASWLVCGKAPESPPAARQVELFEASWHGTQRQEQPAVVGDVISRLLLDHDRIGIDASPVTSQLDLHVSRIDPLLWRLRRHKDPDELALMRKAISCTKKMYERARQIIEPGVPELHVYNELHNVAVETAGERLDPAYLGNDFRCGAGGGSPRDNRPCQAGELYVLDLGPAYRGYFSDNCRVVSVDRKPTDAQMKSWQALNGVFPIVERLARPGVRCRDLYAAANEHLRSAIGAGMTHHLGHGVGLQPHEFPHLNPKWDDVLEVGDIFTCEPGLYGDHLKGGLRLENQYLVTDTGVENLTPFPMELT